MDFIVNWSWLGSKMSDRCRERLRVYHGPVNLGGIAGVTAEWQRRDGHDSDCVVYHSHELFDSAHFDLRIREFRLRWQIPMKVVFFLYCLIRYNVFHFYYGKSLLPLNMDLPILRLFWKKILMNYCGSDIRIMSIEAGRNRYVKLFESEMDNPRRDWRKKVRLRWHRLWVHRAIAIRNLVAYARYAFPERMIISDIWTNNSVDMSEDLAVCAEPRDVPVVVHAPTHLTVKGTAYVEDAVSSLKADGYRFDFRLIQGVSNREAQRIYREEADIIVDQLVAGGFGTLAVEGMLAGKPVIGSLLEEIKDQFCPDCPIVIATVNTVKEKLAWLLNSPEDRERLGREGREFVKKYCDRVKINQQLWDVYEAL